MVHYQLCIIIIIIILFHRCFMDQGEWTILELAEHKLSQSKIKSS